MLGPSEKPKDCDSTFTLNHGFKGYSLRRHLGDSPFFSVHPFLVHVSMLHTPQFTLARQQLRTEIRQRRKNLTPEQQTQVEALFVKQDAERTKWREETRANSQGAGVDREKMRVVDTTVREGVQLLEDAIAAATKTQKLPENRVVR